LKDQVRTLTLEKNLALDHLKGIMTDHEIQTQLLDIYIENIEQENSKLLKNYKRS